MEINERNKSIDIARGVAMLLVIVQHNGGLSDFILSFHMPLFFVISGLCVKAAKPNRSFIDELKNNINCFFLPQLLLGVFELIYIQIMSLYEVGVFRPLSISMIFEAVFRWWFLIVMFQVRLLIWLFRKYIIGCRYIQVIFIVILVLLAIFVEKVPGHFYGTFAYPFIVPVATLFVLFGYYNKYWLMRIGNKSWFWLIICICGTIILSELNGPIMMYKAEYGNMILFIMSSVLGSIFVIKFSSSIRSPFLVWMGKMSLPIYVLQFHLNHYCRAIQALCLDYLGCENESIKITVTIVLSLTVCTVIARYIRNKKILSILFGVKNI